jgi:hypothetical protein
MSSGALVARVSRHPGAGLRPPTVAGVRSLFDVAGRWWKLIGLAGLAGVAATGVVVARDERRRRGYTPQEVRDRLHERYAQASEPASAVVPGQAGPAAGTAEANGARRH